MRKVKTTITAAIAIGLLAGGAVGATAQEEATERAAPVQFTGELAFGPCPVDSEIESTPGKQEWRGEHYCRPVVVEPFSDERLAGDYYVWNHRDVHDGGPTIFASTFSIVNDEGAWRGIPARYIRGTGSNQILVGEGAYDGLTAIASVTGTGGGWAWDGWIIESDAPPLPEEPAAIP